MKHQGCFTFFVVVVVLGIIGSLFFKSVDIKDRNAVIDDMQGIWIGYSHDGHGEYQYNHYKIVVSNNKYEGWIQIARTSDEPEWNINPDITGTWSLSEVLTYTNADSRYRNIYFNEVGDDVQLKARLLQKMIVYDGGLYVVGWGQMSKK